MPKLPGRVPPWLISEHPRSGKCWSRAAMEFHVPPRERTSRLLDTGERLSKNRRVRDFTVWIINYLRSLAKHVPGWRGWLITKGRLVG